MDCKRGLEANLICIFSDQLSSNRVERSGPWEINSPITQSYFCNSFHPVRHFFRRPSGEGQEQNTSWVHSLDDKMGDPIREDLCLSGPSTSDYQQWVYVGRWSVLETMLDGSTLLTVQIFQILEGGF